MWRRQVLEQPGCSVSRSHRSNRSAARRAGPDRFADCHGHGSCGRYEPFLQGDGRVPVGEKVRASFGYVVYALYTALRKSPGNSSLWKSANCFVRHQVDSTAYQGGSSGNKSRGALGHLLLVSAAASRTAQAAPRLELDAYLQVTSAERFTTYVTFADLRRAGSQGRRNRWQRACRVRRLEAAEQAEARRAGDPMRPLPE